MLKGLIPQIGAKLDKHSPLILTVLSVVGLAATAYLVATETPKANSMLDQYARQNDIPEEDIPFKDKAVILGKAYAPAIICGAVTSGMIIGSNVISTKRLTASTIAADIATTTYETYRDTVIDKIGAKKEDEIHGEAIQRMVEREHVSYSAETKVPLCGTGETLFLDRVSGRYFFSDIEYIRKQLNDANAMLLQDGWFSLNDWYELIGLDEIAIGDNLGWQFNDRRNELIDLHEASILGPDSTPTFTISFAVLPRWY